MHTRVSHRYLAFYAYLADLSAHNSCVLDKETPIMIMCQYACVCLCIVGAWFPISLLPLYAIVSLALIMRLACCHQHSCMKRERRNDQGVLWEASRAMGHGLMGSSGDDSKGKRQVCWLESSLMGCDHHNHAHSERLLSQCV